MQLHSRIAPHLDPPPPLPSNFYVSGQEQDQQNSVRNFVLTIKFDVGKLQCHDLGVLTVENSICVCIGDTLLYSCTVSGGVSTVWQGSAFDNCRITLLHSHFVSGRETSGTCNHGSIVARSAWYSINYSTNISYYTSYLTVTATPDLNNTDIQCLLHINSQSFVPIESYNISIISGILQLYKNYYNVHHILIFYFRICTFTSN